MFVFKLLSIWMIQFNFFYSRIIKRLWYFKVEFGDRFIQALMFVLQTSNDSVNQLFNPMLHLIAQKYFQKSSSNDIQCRPHRLTDGQYTEWSHIGGLRKNIDSHNRGLGVLREVLLCVLALENALRNWVCDKNLVGGQSCAALFETRLD